MNRGFGSDNHSGVHPQLLKAILDANQNHAPSYGTDDISLEAEKVFKYYFGPESEVHFVFNGTAANVLSLKAMIQSYESVLVTNCSHLNVDECGAPEFFTGGKLIPLPSEGGKLKLYDLEKALIRKGDQHFSQVKAISITQPTEYGTCYCMDELKQISEFAKKNNLYLHIDGARFCNSLFHLNCDLKDFFKKIPVDVISFGGTKNGFLFGEAIVILNPKLNQNFKFIRKQAAQLPSKTRFVAAQFLTFLKNDLWKVIATNQCQKAQTLHQELLKIPQLEVTQACQSNAVFVKIPKELVKDLRKHTFFYVWDEHTFECRLMTSWDTEESDIHEFVTHLKGLL
jgi:threonine aldolase